MRREYPSPDSYITSNGTKCLLLSVEMKKGFNIVDMGNDVNQAIAEFQQTIPEEVNIYRITDQSVVVDQSVWTFLRELLFAIVAVVIVVMLLLPMRVALVAASTIPITIFISLGLYYAFNIELNTCTLAALIVTLGMIVDNSIVIIDNNLESIGEGRSRWHASIDSTIHFFKSIFSATLAISITFFPFLIVCSGMIQDFVLSFPWAVTIVLGTSLLIATMLVPFMQYFFIRKPLKVKQLLYNEAVCPIEIHLSNDNFIGAPIVAAVMIYVILLSHFRNVKLSTLVALSMLLCLLGAALGLKIQGIDFSVTSVLGLTSLMGIIVRNGIIMIDYAEELRTAEHMSVRGAILCSASRRMRPIFLTSAAAAMGVIPMILGGSGLWMPMGTVICYGTLISMLFILTVIPVAYLLVFQKKGQR